MTIRQKQCLLAYLGCYGGAIDGVWGEQSRQAVQAFRRAYGLEPVNGVFDEAAERRILEVIAGGEAPAGDWWQDILYFDREEFRCPCGRCGGFPVEPSERLVRLADGVRGHFGSPAVVSSGVRCRAHNDELSGSVPNSYHLRGLAMDFCVRGVSGEALLSYVQKQNVRYAYRIGGTDYVHMDVNEGKDGFFGNG